MLDYKLENSGKILIISNFICIVLAIIFNYDFLAVIWAFWIESIIIGIFTFSKLFILGDKFKAPMRIRVLGQAPKTKMISGIFVALFFAFHYGFFHFVYFFFLSFLSVGILASQSTLQDVLFGTFLTILMAIILFFSHLYSFYLNIYQRRKQIKPDKNFVSTAFIGPYARIIPIHIIIILSMFLLPFILKNPICSSSLLIIFMLLKTIADFYAHQKKHKLSSESSTAGPS